jgi:hypothetical protein
LTRADFDEKIRDADTNHFWYARARFAGSLAALAVCVGQHFAMLIQPAHRGRLNAPVLQVAQGDHGLGPEDEGHHHAQDCGLQDQVRTGTRGESENWCFDNLFDIVTEATFTLNPLP